LISVIDDDESMRSAILALVRSAGYDAHGFASAEEFLGSGIVQSFAWIIAHIQLPSMSGIELKRHLAACQSALPVIMITAHHHLEKKSLRVARLVSSGSRLMRTRLSGASKEH
jgi:FixJ family two-component response regulator